MQIFQENNEVTLSMRSHLLRHNAVHRSGAGCRLFEVAKAGRFGLRQGLRSGA